MRERVIENRLRRLAPLHRWVVRKLRWTGRRGATDNLLLRAIAPEHQAIVAQYIRFVECKKPDGGVVEAHQTREHERLRAMGFRVDVVDSVAAVEAEYGK